ncbi:MAG: MBG domain-containing protein, partial [Ekhidna sp.]
MAAIISQSSGSVDWSYVKLKDISATGGATFSANNSIDNGNNTGWTINEYAGQDYYWVGDGGNWSDYENHWATTSGGSTMHTDYPNSLDDVYFDENSFTIEGQTVIQDIEGGTSFGNMDWTGALNSPSLSSSYSFNLKAHGSVIFIDGMSRDLYGFDVLGNETGQLLDMSGSGSITFLSIQGEGEYDLLSDISVGVFTQRSGTVNYNGVSIDCSIDFDLGHNELVANFGSATITCRDFTHNSSSSTITGTPSLTVERNFEGNGVQFYEVTLSGSGNVLGSNTFEILQIQPGVNTILDAGETQTINQTLTLQGTKSSPISLSSDEAGTQSSISVSSGTIDAIYLTLKDINATGGATFNATQTLDNGNNTGWNITGLTALDYYWVGDGGSWSDFENHWATTSGGSTMHTDAPGVLDKVYFDANSFTLTDQTVTVDGGDISFHDMDWTGVTNNPSFDSDGNGLNVYGSMDFDPSVSIQLNDVYFVSTEAETITLQDDEPGTSAYFYFTGSGSWTFNSGFTVRELHQYSGDIDINGNKVLVDFRTDFFGEDAKTMTLGASDFFTRSLSIGSASNLTFDGSNSFISSSSSFSTLGGSDNTFSFNEFTFTRYNSTDEGILSADMTFNKLTFEANTDIELRAGITITTNELIAVGTADDPITIISQTEGTTATISQASGTVDAYYLELQDITATGGATFNAFSSIDNGNVSGWTFNRLSQTIDFTDIPDMPLDAPDFELEATATSGLPVSFEVISGNVELVGDGSTVSILGGGPVQIQARQAGNIDYDPAPSVVKSFTVTKLGQTIVFEELASKTVLDEDFELEATGGGSGNPVTFTSSNLDVATVTGSLVSIIGEGSTTITASQAGNDDYDAAADVEQVLTVTKPLQVIVFGEIPDRKLTDPDFELSATGGDSGNPVTFSSSDITIAEIDGNTVSILGAGTVTITASQAGNENYEPAEDVERTFTVYDPSQSIEFGELESVSYGDAAFNLTATASSELEVMYLSSDEDVAQVSGSLVTIVGVGTTTITAYQDGDEIFDHADEVTQDLVVNPAILSVTAEDKTKVYGDANPTLTVVYDGFVNNEDESVLNTEPTVNTEADATSVVGEYSITLQGGSADNYELERIEGVLEVTKRDLTAVADDQFMREGDFVPELTISYVGLVNNDSGSDIDIPPAISTTASSASPIGEYPITLAGGEDNNYLIVERIEGTLIVDKALGTDINELLEVSFYPNPVSGFLTVQSDGKMRNLEIRSLDGRLIGNYTINQNKKI